MAQINPAEHKQCSTQADCGSLTCLPNSTGGACARCFTHSDPERNTCSFYPPEEAARQCMGFGSPPADSNKIPAPVQAAISASSTSRGIFDDGNVQLDDEYLSMLECMRTLDREFTGCCQGEICVPRVDSGAHHTFVPGKCEIK